MEQEANRNTKKEKKQEKYFNKTDARDKNVN